MPDGTSRISVLCVDDEPEMADLIGSYLERTDDRFVTTTATNPREALEQFDPGSFDCIVSDYDMPELDGLMFLDAVRADHPKLPFILFTGRGSEEIASDAISRGVTDYMQKGSGTDQYQVLAQRVRNAVTRHRLSREATSARKHAETILEASPNAIIVSIDGRCVYVNPSALSLIPSYSEGELLGSQVATILQNDGEGNPFEAIEQNDDGALEQARLTIGPNDEAVPVEGTARNITWDGEPAVVYILRDITDQIAYEQEIEFQQSLLNSTFEASPDGIVITDRDRTIIDYNEQFADIWGFSEDVLDERNGKIALDVAEDIVVDPESLREFVTKQYQNPEETQHGQIRLQDGRVLDGFSTGARTEDGELLGIVWFYRDITDIKRLEQTQQEAFNRMTDAVFALNEDWEFTFLNEQAEQLLQRDADDLLGENVWAEFPGAKNSILYDRYHEAARTGEPDTLEMYYDPLEAEFEIRVFPSDTGLTVYFRDITEERQTQSELVETVETLRGLYEVASDTDASFEEKQQKLLTIGCEYLGSPYGFVTEVTESTQTIVAATGDHELLQPGETCPLGQSYCRKTILNDDGLLAIQHAHEEGWEEDPAYETFRLESYIGGRVVVNGELYGTVCFASSEPRETEFSDMEQTFVELLSRWMGYELEQREHQEKLEAKNAQLEEFASIISHDLRNPLSVANGYLELAMEDGDSDHLRRVEQAQARMDELIDDILTLAREGDVVGDLTQVDLEAVAKSGWQNVATQDAQLDVETDTTIVADKTRIEQLLENLFRNAVEHGGRDVTVRVGSLPDGFYVEDDGRGIPDEMRNTLFQSGVSSKEEGTGIGLRIVEQIVTAHGWDISVTASSDGGARFEVTGVEQA